MEKEKEKDDGTLKQKYGRCRRGPSHAEQTEQDEKYELLRRLTHFERRGWRCPQRVSRDTSLDELRLLVALAEGDDEYKLTHKIIRKIIRTMQELAEIYSDRGLDNLEKLLEKGEIQSGLIMPILVTKGFAAMDPEVLKRLWDKYQEVPFAKARQTPNDESNDDADKEQKE